MIVVVWWQFDGGGSFCCCFTQQFTLWQMHLINMKNHPIRYRYLHVSLCTTQWYYRKYGGTAHTAPHVQNPTLALLPDTATLCWLWTEWAGFTLDVVCQKFINDSMVTQPTTLPSCKASSYPIITEASHITQRMNSGFSGILSHINPISDITPYARWQYFLSISRPN